MLGLRGDKADLQKLKVAFQSMDTDNDGSLTTKEIMAAEKTLKSFKIGGKW